MNMGKAVGFPHSHERLFMEIYTPEYYHQFRCLASACPDSCCKEWEVDVDACAAAYYRALPGPLGDRLRQVLRDEDDCTLMTITDGRCPMWRQDGLCRIQAELGHDALCQVCREFPRLRHDYGNFVELGLELSCPEAARLIFASPSHCMAVETVAGGDAPEYDMEVMQILRRSRETALDFLESKQYPLGQSLAILLLYGHAVQSEIDGADEAVFQSDTLLADAREYAEPNSPETLFAFFRNLEILTEQWRHRLSCAKPCGWQEVLRPLARYGIQRYWLQAVSDYDLICRVKLIVAACLLVNGMGGDPVQTAQLFSKEVENNSDNVDTILDAAYTSPAFTDVYLLSLLLNP